MSENNLSVYQHGASDGLLMGPLMGLTAILFGASAYHAWLFLPALLGMIAVPSLAYYRMAQTYRSFPLAATFSALWLEGICMFFFGSLIMAIFIYVAVKMFCPDFIVDQARLFVDFYGQIDDPQLQEIVRGIERAIATHSLPSPVAMAFEMVYFATFTGSMVSLLLALLVRAHRPPKPPKFNPEN